MIMKKQLFIVSVLFCVLPIICFADNYVIINQVMYDTPLNEQPNISPCSNGEYIELYNAGTTIVHLQGWRITGGSQSEIWTFGTNDSIPAGGFLILACKRGKTNTFVLSDLYNQLTGTNHTIVYQNKIMLDNTNGETVTLYNAQNDIVDQMSYGNSNHLYATNANNLSGDSCISLHRTGMEFDADGKVIQGTGQWRTELVSFDSIMLPYETYSENYIIGGQPLPTGENYIISVSPLDPTTRVTITDVSVSVSSSVRTQTAIQYYDGLGRPDEHIAIETSPSGKDLVQVTNYTGLKRVDQQWLPVPMQTEGQRIDVSSVKTQTQSYYEDNRPFVETIYENSALNRIAGNKRQGDTWASHPTSNIYSVNTTSDNVRVYTVLNNGKLKTTGAVYPSRTLYKTTEADEDGKQVTTYTDKLGKTVMEDRAGNSTYYVYDNLERLRFVLPHIPSSKLADGEYTLSDSTLRAAAYCYNYDDRGNVIYKRLPGCEPQYMVYDQLGQLVLKQDGNQRAEDKWIMCAYDSLGRNLYTAEIQLPQSHDDYIAFFADKWQVEHYRNNPSNISITGTGYGSTLLGNSNLNLLTLNYYDNYEFINILPIQIRQELQYSQLSGYGEKYDNVTGLLTGTRVYNLSESGFTETAYFYDEKGRVVQNRSIRGPDNYQTVTSTEYLFDGSVAQQLTEQETENNLVREHYRYTYDHAGRPINTYYQLNNDAEITLSAFSYDSIGNLAQNLFHNNIDTIWYSYDMRNMLTETNNKHFSERLYYADNLPLHASPCYNGNISAARIAQTDTAFTFDYTYDALNRLTESVQEDNNQTKPSEWFQYDSIGNITRLQRYSGPRLMDDLTFTYQPNGNLLLSVKDEGLDANRYGMIEYYDRCYDPLIENNDMRYDANGNLIYDADRDISVIRYNILNLPDTIQFVNGNQIVNLYDASGKKYKSIYYTNLSTSATSYYEIAHYPLEADTIWYNITKYDGNIETRYSRIDTTRRIFNSIGYFADSTYYHYIQDHLGNNCAVVHSVADTLVQSTIYYASGVPMAQSLGPNVPLLNYTALGVQYTENFGWDVQPYLYNGKEFVEVHGLNEYDSQARWYYAPIMRTTTMDPLAEKYYHISPYAWCANNPVNVIDPNGRDIRWESKREGKIYQQYKKVVNSRESKAAKEVAKINKKLQKNPKNRAALLVKLAKAEQKLGTYQQIQCELAAMEGPGNIFVIRTAKGDWGVTTQNPETKEVYINITSDDDQAIMSVSHELCHGYQYLDGRLDFSEDGEGGGELYDLTDEREAIQRQNLFDPSLNGYSDDTVDALTEIQLENNYPELSIYRRDPRPAPIDVRPQILIYRPDEERSPR